MRLNTKIAAILGVCAIATQASAQTLGAEAAQTTNQVTDFGGNFPTRGPTMTDATEGGRMYRGGQMNQDNNNNYNRGGEDKMNGGRGQQGGQKEQGKGQMNGGDRKEGQKNEGRGQKDGDKDEGEKGWMSNGKGGKGQKDEGQGEKGWMTNGKGGQKDRGDMKKHRDYDNDDMIHRPMNGRGGYKWTDDERDSCDSGSENEDRRIRRWSDNDDDDNEGRRDRKKSNKKRWEQEDSCDESGNDTEKWTDREDDCDSEHQHGDDHDNKRVGRRHNNKMNFGMKKHNENRSDKKRWGQEEDSCEESGNDTNKWTDREDDCESEPEHEHDNKKGGKSHHLRGRFTEQTCDNDNDCNDNNNHHNNNGGFTSISKREEIKTTTKFGLSPAFIVKLKDAQMRAEGAKVVLDGVLCDLEQAQDEVEKADRRLTKLLKKIVHQKKEWTSKKNHSE